MFDPTDPESCYAALCRYRDVRPDYELLAKHLEKVLHAMARDLGIYPIVTGRAKSLESFAEKIQRPGKSYGADPAAEMTDLCGVRIITHTLDEVDALAGAVRRRFNVDLRKTEDKREKLAFNKFGYLSTHFIIQLKKTPQIEGEPPKRLRRLPTLKAELQLRTLAQHLWADVYHELGYKNEFKLPPLYERQFARLAALLEACDKGFQEIKNAMHTYESSYGTYMSNEQLESLVRRLEILLRVDTDNVRAVHRLVRGHLALGNKTAIREILARSSTRLQSYPPALRDVGVALCQVDEEQGQKLLRQVVDAAPKDVDALCSLGGSYRRQGRLEEARDCYQRAHEIDHSDPYALGNYIALELVRRGDARVIDYFHAPITEAIQRCSMQVEVKVNLPWALFDLGLFELYLKHPASAIAYYAKGIDVASDPGMIRTANSTIESLLSGGIQLDGLRLLDKLLKLGWWAKAGPEERNKSAWRPSPGPVVFQLPVLILAGGCDGLEDTYAPLLEALKQALVGCRRTVVSGGTRSGIAGLVGDLQEICGAGRLQTVGYLTAAQEAQVDTRYSDHRYTDGSRFSPLEALTFWEDFLAAGGDPKSVKLIGFNGGEIAACEFRIALALGAQVGIIEGSGRAADDLLLDALWKDHRGDPPSLHALDLARRGDVERFSSG